MLGMGRFERICRKNKSGKHTIIMYFVSRKRFGSGFGAMGLGFFLGLDRASLFEESSS